MSIEIKHHNDNVYKVYNFLKTKIGIENAISANDLCILCNISDKRELREIIREMRRSGDFEEIPCSCNNGYYMASVKEEAEKAIERLVNTAKNELKTAYSMEKKLGLDNQMKIKFDELCNDTYHALMEKEDEFNKKSD